MKTNGFRLLLIFAVTLTSLSSLALEPSVGTQEEAAKTAEPAAVERDPASAAQQTSPQTAPPRRSLEPQRRRLSEEDQRILMRGPIPQGRYIGGGITGSIVGFGIGHAIQGGGRYRQRGWIFTAGEGGSIGLMLVGVFQCLGDSSNYNDDRDRCDRGAGIAGAGVIGLIGFHIWEVIDLWVAPPKINRRYEQLTRDSHREVSFKMAPIMVTETTPGLGMRLEF